MNPMGMRFLLLCPEKIEVVSCQAVCLRFIFGEQAWKMIDFNGAKSFFGNLYNVVQRFSNLHDPLQALPLDVARCIFTCKLVGRKTSTCYDTVHKSASWNWKQ